MNRSTSQQCWWPEAGYLHAAGYFRDLETIVKDLPSESREMSIELCRRIHIPRFASDLAFVSEILIKTLLAIRSIEFGKGHKINGLFRALPEQVQSEITLSYDSACDRSATLRSITMATNSVPRLIDSEILSASKAEPNRSRGPRNSLTTVLNESNDLYSRFRYFPETSNPAGLTTYTIYWEALFIFAGVLKMKVEAELGKSMQSLPPSKN